MRRHISRFIVITGLLGIVATPAIAQTPQAATPPVVQTPQAGTPPVVQSTEYVRTYFLTHADAIEMQQVLSQLVQSRPGQRPIITVSRGTNALTIRGTETILRELEEVIKQLDVPQVAAQAGARGAGGTEAPPAPGPAQSRLPNLPLLPATTNIRIELTITDTYGDEPATKTVSMVILNSSGGLIRTSQSGQAHWLNVDAMAAAYQNGMIGVRLSFEFQPPPTLREGRAPILAPQLNESLTVVVFDGRPMTISQAADAGSDRTVTATITATVLK